MRVKDIITEEQFEHIGELTYEDALMIVSKLIRVSAEESLKMLPTVMSHMTKQAAHLRDISEKFYLNHPELQMNKKMVAEIIEKVESENPGQSYEKILELTVPIAQSRLKTLKSVHTKIGSKSLEDLDDGLGKL